MNYLAGEAYIGVSKKVYVRIFPAYTISRYDTWRAEKMKTKTINQNTESEE